MWRIVNKLYLGDAKDAFDRQLLESVGITHVLNCAMNVPCRHRRHFRYLHLELNDGDPDFYEHIPRFCKFVHRGRRAGAVLVHCRSGLHRSPAAIVAYLRWRGKSIDEALALLQKRVGEDDASFHLPSDDFLEQIETYFENERDDD